MREPNPGRVRAFDQFFARAMELELGKSARYSFPYQGHIALAEDLPGLVAVPTGCGKTAAIILAWIWRRLCEPDQRIRRATPRRLVYCLPMRTLVEQTAASAHRWVSALSKSGVLGNDVPVHVLMGGEPKDDWDLHPEREAILVGTQDMLLSRALNRGYAATRARWPIQFGLLNTDSLWVFDETQLMGAGLATTAQIEGFRHKLGSKDGHGSRTIWMSATMQLDWLKTVDFDTASLGEPRELTQEDLEHPEIAKRRNANKTLVKADSTIGDSALLAGEICQEHKRGTRTIVVVNTVRRACELFSKLEKGQDNSKPAPRSPRLVLLHSRFRPRDRQNQIDAALAEPGEAGTIVVSTQVIEAGVDVTSRTLFTELAPWTSLVQRFGRCNRNGEYQDHEARVYWICLPDDDAEAANLAPPYETNELIAAAKRLRSRDDVGLKSLTHHVDEAFQHRHVIRRKDLVDLFDTTPDLAGNDIDIDRFVRGVEESDICVLWRDWERQRRDAPPPEDEPAPRREELCRVPIGSFREFAKKQPGQAWRWSFKDREWQRPDLGTIAPGQVILIHADAGGYEPTRGWSEKSSAPVDPVEPVDRDETTDDPPESTEDEPLSRINVWQTIAEHADDLCEELDAILDALPGLSVHAATLRAAARWHDRGKAHSVFQRAIDDGQLIVSRRKETKRRERPEVWRGCRFVAKAPDRRRTSSGTVVDLGFWRSYERKHFRHELASALAILDPRNDLVPDGSRDLVAYLVAAHHGKVRLSIRSLPGEKVPPSRRFARGVWDGDILPITDLGGGVVAPEIELSLEPMELGLCEQPPFMGEPSWAERMIGLRDEHGPFQLAYLEAILRAADMRASKAAAERAVSMAEATAQAEDREFSDG